MTDNSTPNDIALLREAGDYLIDSYRRLWKGGVVRDLAEAEAAWSHAKAALARQHDGGAIPAGMKPWGPASAGYPNEPQDWDGGPYLCRDGKMYHMCGYDWGHGTHCTQATADWDRIAYTPKPSTEQARAEVGYEVWQGDAFGDGDAPVAGSTSLADALHYAAVYGQDGPAWVVEVTRRPLAAPSGADALGGRL